MDWRPSVSGQKIGQLIRHNRCNIRKQKVSDEQFYPQRIRLAFLRKDRQCRNTLQRDGEKNQQRNARSQRKVTILNMLYQQAIFLYALKTYHR